MGYFHLQSHWQAGIGQKRWIQRELELMLFVHCLCQLRVLRNQTEATRFKKIQISDRIKDLMCESCFMNHIKNTHKSTIIISDVPLECVSSSIFSQKYNHRQPHTDIIYQINNIKRTFSFFCHETGQEY